MSAAQSIKTDVRIPTYAVRDGSAEPGLVTLRRLFLDRISNQCCSNGRQGVSHPWLASAHRRTRTTTDRLGLPLDLLQDPALDTLLTGISHLNESPEVMRRLASGDLPALCHVVT